MVYTLNAVEELNKVREILKDESSWCKGAFARDEHSQACDVQSQRACRFCFEGAVRRATGKNYGNHCFPYVRAAVIKCKGVDSEAPMTFGSVSLFNDHPKTTHQDVLDAIDRAIAFAEIESK